MRKPRKRRSGGNQREDGYATEVLSECACGESFFGTVTTLSRRSPPGLRRMACALLLLVAAGLTIGASASSNIRTLEPSVLTVAVTSLESGNPYDSQLWIRRYVERFAAEHRLTIKWVVVPFNQSWLLASRNEVDLVATNVASFRDRVHSGATFSAPFLFERRALRIHPKDHGRYAHINDFVGKRVGVVRGMAAERDVRRRAPEGVAIVTTDSFAELYEQFDAGQLDAIAEAEYFALDGRVIPSHGDEVVLIDLHDLVPGQREESVFVVSDASTGLLAAVNAFIARTPFPL
jgi:ABC-type amino acid transport substrate-binding protein